MAQSWSSYHSSSTAIAPLLPRSRTYSLMQVLNLRAQVGRWPMVLSKEKTHDNFQHLQVQERRFRSVSSVGFGLYRCPTHLSPSPKHLKLNPKPPTNYGADPNAWARDVRGPRDPIYLHLSQQARSDKSRMVTDTVCCSRATRFLDRGPKTWTLAYVDRMKRK